MFVAGLVLLSLVAACTSSSSEDDAQPSTSTTETTVEETVDGDGDAAELVAAALGDVIPTQDFHLVSDIERVDDAGDELSIHDQVVGALTPTAEPTPIGDTGMTYAPAEGLTGRVVDEDGEPVPGAEVGFGLIDLDDDISDEDALALLDPDGELGLTAEELRDDPTLVVFSTTGTEDGPATLIAPGDQFELDLTFVEDLAPGDLVRETLISGQAFPSGDDVERGMGAGETFAHRLTSGSVAVLAGEDGQPAIAVSEREAVEGSTLSRKHIKVLKYAPKALLGAGLVVGVCYAAVRPGPKPPGGAKTCAKGAKSMADAAKEDGKRDNARNRREPPCTKGCGAAGGEVHFRTLDGEYYDLQSAGEFVAARSDAGHEIQLRMAPLYDLDDISVNTAVAASVDGQTVAIHLVDGSIELFVDDEEATLPRGSFLPLGDGGAIVDAGDTFMLLWSDGTRADVTHRKTHMDLTLDPASTDVTWEGLLGDGDGDRENDLVLADGTVVVDRSAESLHGDYADAWRVTDETSLLHYEDGESTETHTDRDFPRDHASLDTLDPEARAEAEAICTDYGISEPAAFDACVFDLALTGDPGFLFSAAAFEHAAVGSAGVTGDGDERSVGAAIEIPAVEGSATEDDVPVDGLLAWLRADDAGDGDVERWVGRGPNAVEAEREEGGVAPRAVTIAGDRFVRFVEQASMDLPFSIQPATVPELTIAIVLVDEATESSMRKAYGHDDGGFDRTVGYDDRLPDGCYGVFTGSTVEPYAALARDEVYVLTDVWTADTFTGHVDGTEVVSHPVQNGVGSNKFFLGASGTRYSEHWEGAIAEVLVWDRALDDAERATVNAYLVDRYGPSGPVFECPEG